MVTGKVIKSDDATTWATTWEWEVDAPVKVVWWWSGDFMADDKWMTSVVRECCLVGGRSNEIGCVRRSDCYRAPFVHGQENEYPPEFVFYGLQKLLSLDNDTHSYSYSAVGGNLPGFDEGFVDYKSFYSVVKAPGTAGSAEKSLVRWGYTCQPSHEFTKEQCDSICFELYDLALNDLKKCISQSAASR